MVNVEVSPIEWDDWKVWEYSGKGYSHYINPTLSVDHYLTELGHSTNGYEYTARLRSNERNLLKLVLRPGCCGNIPCPIGKQALPANPCRDYMRREAERLAYDAWVQYVRDLAEA